MALALLQKYFFFFWGEKYCMHLNIQCKKLIHAIIYHMKYVHDVHAHTNTHTQIYIHIHTQASAYGYNSKSMFETHII